MQRLEPPSANKDLFSLRGENPAVSSMAFRAAKRSAEEEKNERKKTHWERFTPHGFPDCLIDCVCIVTEAGVKPASRRPPSAEDVSLHILIRRVFHRPFEGAEARELHWREGGR